MAFRFDGKLNDRYFCYFTTALLVHLAGTPTWRLHIKLFKIWRFTFPNNARMNNHTNPNLGEVVDSSLIFYIPALRLNLFNAYIFFVFSILRDSANQPLHHSAILPFLSLCLYLSVYLYHLLSISSSRYS